MSKQILIEPEQTFSICDNKSIMKVKCVEDNNNVKNSNEDSCSKCIFNKTHICNNMACIDEFRPDGLNVHFEYIKL